MNYLAGPLTRAQIPALNELAGSAFSKESAAPAETTPKPAASLSDFQPVPAPSASAPPRVSAPDLPGSRTRPAFPASVGEYFLPLNLSLVEAFDAAKLPLTDEDSQIGILYRPALVAVAQTRFLNRKYNVDTLITRAVLIPNEEVSGAIRWDSYFVSLDPDSLGETPAPQARFIPPQPPLDKARPLASLKRDFADMLYRTLTVTARANTALKVYAGPNVTSAEFMQTCAEAARAARDAEIDKVSAQYERKIRTLKNKLKREERELKQDEEELSERKWEELGTHAENFLGIGRSRRRLSTSLTKHRLTQQAKADVEESIEAIEDYQAQIEELEAELEETLEEIRDRWGNLVNDIEEIPIAPKKADIFLPVFGIGWMPYYLVRRGETISQIPAWGEG
jgi:ribosome-associated translation inhibitor RaiA